MCLKKNKNKYQMSRPNIMRRHKKLLQIATDDIQEFIRVTYIEKFPLYTAAPNVHKSARSRVGNFYFEISLRYAEHSIRIPLDKLFNF